MQRRVCTTDGLQLQGDLSGEVVIRIVVCIVIWIVDRFVSAE